MSDDREREHCELVATSVYEAFGDDLARPARAEVAGLYRRYRDELGSFTAAHEKSRVEWVADLIQRERAAAAAEAVTKYRHEELHGEFLRWRGIEEPCKDCGGSGRRAYANTTGWRGGIGGQSITDDVCDKCWGTGDARRKGADLRRLMGEVERAAAEARDKALEAAAKVARAAGDKALSIPFYPASALAEAAYLIERGIRALLEDDNA